MHLLVFYLCISFSYLVHQQSYGCDECGVRVLSRCGHVCQCGEEGDAIRAVHFTQPVLKPVLVLCVWHIQLNMTVANVNIRLGRIIEHTFLKMVLKS